MTGVTAAAVKIFGQARHHEVARALVAADEIQVQLQVVSVQAAVRDCRVHRDCVLQDETRARGVADRVRRADVVRQRLGRDAASARVLLDVHVAVVAVQGVRAAVAQGVERAAAARRRLGRDLAVLVREGALAELHDELGVAAHGLEDLRDEGLLRGELLLHLLEPLLLADDAALDDLAVLVPLRANLREDLVLLQRAQQPLVEDVLRRQLLGVLRQAVVALVRQRPEPLVPQALLRVEPDRLLRRVALLLGDLALRRKCEHLRHPEPVHLLRLLELVVRRRRVEDRVRGGGRGGELRRAPEGLNPLAQDEQRPPVELFLLRLLELLTCVESHGSQIPFLASGYKYLFFTVPILLKLFSRTHQESG